MPTFKPRGSVAAEICGGVGEVTRSVMCRVIVGSVVLLAALMTLAGTATASTVRLCVPKNEGSAVLTAKHGKCKNGYKLTTLGQQGKEGKQGAEGKGGAEGKPGAEGKEGKEGKAGTMGLTSGELETLKSILPYVRYVAAGVGGKPTIQFSAVNVQVVNGEGVTTSVNGEGNLVIGYDEHAAGKRQTGSHDLVLGEEQDFTSYGDVLAGVDNRTLGPFDSVTGGQGNAATAPASSVSGGTFNAAKGEDASVSGGTLNTAEELATWIGGGDENEALGEVAAVAGGAGNTAGARYTSILGGKHVTIDTEYGTSP